MLWLFILGTVLELLLFLPGIWKLRKPIAAFSIAVTFGASLWIVYAYKNAGALLILLTSIYRVINLMRLLEAKMHESYLHRVVLRSSLWLLGTQVILAGVWALFAAQVISLGRNELLLIIAVLQLLCALLILSFTVRNIRKSRYKPNDVFYSSQELPTITVGIPARNETDELQRCIESVIASDYPKLEILVLDDCSQDRTAEIIRSYAQSGVRFIHGSEPKENWLAKNQAYDQLANEANGEFIVFMGADTQVGIRTITSLVTLALNRKKRMLSVLPKRTDQSISASIVQPMRYWWELALPRRLFNRPAVLSTLWMIERNTLQKAGGFEAVSRSVIPESYFAKQLVSKDAYGFVRSGGDLLVLTVKSFHDQFDRAIRYRYPEVHRRLELVLGLSLAETGLFLLPFVVFIVGLFIYIPAALVAAGACMLLIVAQYLILAATSTATAHFALINFILAILMEIFVGNYSMYKYEFSEVDWKGRNICIPVMHTVAHLLQE